MPEHGRGRSESRSPGDEARLAVGETKEQIKAGAESAVDRAKAEAKDVGADVRDRAEHKLTEQKQKASTKVHAVARALREAGESLEEQGERDLARYGRETADRVEEFSSYLGDRPVGDMVHNLESMGRRNPAAFLGTTFTAGVLLGRFLRSSSDEHRGERSHRRHEPDERTIREQQETEVRYE